MNYKKELGPPIALIVFCVGIIYLGLKLGFWIMSVL